MRILIAGDGVAARCCALHLEFATVFCQRTPRPQIPAILLGDAAQQLMRGVFQHHPLFSDSFSLTQRIVAWQPETSPAAFPHSAVVTSEASLLKSLPELPSEPDSTPCDWTLHAAGTRPQQAFGTRIASSFPATLHPQTQPNTCWIESLSTGWLFLVPTSPLVGWLLAVGTAPETLLAESRVIAKQLERYGAASGQFPAYPRIAVPLAAPIAAPGWLACGASAIGFDPICGDGTAHAVREGILAAAVLRAIARGGNPEALCAHYNARLIAGFARHLQLCREFYLVPRGEWWRNELNALDRGLLWCQEQAQAHGPFRFRLQGNELVG